MSRNPFLEMLTAPEQEIPGTFWATVTATSPLRVKRDTEPVLPVTPQTLANLSVGDRVLCLWERRQVIILGRMGGPAPPPMAVYPSMNRINIGGTLYQVSGTRPVPAFNWSGPMGGFIYYTGLQMPIPYTPPSGWTFQWTVAEAQRHVIVTNSDRYPSGSGTQHIRIMQFNDSLTTGLQRLRWTITPDG